MSERDSSSRAKLEPLVINDRVVKLELLLDEDVGVPMLIMTEYELDGGTRHAGHPTEFILSDESVRRLDIWLMRYMNGVRP